MIPMWTISQMARGQYGCNREQSLSNLSSLVQHHPGLLLDGGKSEGRGIGNWFCPLVFLNVIITNDPQTVSRSIFCSNNNKNGNIYMQIWPSVKKTPRQLQNLASVPIFHTVKRRKPILASHLLRQSQNLFH